MTKMIIFCLEMQNKEIFFLGGDGKRRKKSAQVCFLCFPFNIILHDIDVSTSFL